MAKSRNRVFYSRDSNQFPSVFGYLSLTQQKYRIGSFPHKNVRISGSIGQTMSLSSGKVVWFSRQMWRSLRKVSGYRPGNFIWFHNLSSFIPFSIANCDLLAFLIFRGSTYNLKTVNPYCVGFRVGSFIRTRKLAAYKSKIMKKKRDKALKLAAEQRARAKRRVYIRFKQAHQVVHRKNYWEGFNKDKVLKGGGLGSVNFKNSTNPKTLLMSRVGW